jgi:hypothetical protein
MLTQIVDMSRITRALSTANRGFWQILNGSLMGTANGYEIARLTVAAAAAVAVGTVL